ncbi:cytochrome P450 9e2-like [Venturia canescens]|uniref:cytochrome P450 9e2-like n=1 Tax=Venturia canescens TaxID=32260 RepID=UPI001C9BBFDA|nr:cytochrome P450 9e2-like [Venturia canescens]
MVLLNLLLWGLALVIIGILVMIGRQKIYWRLRKIPYIDGYPGFGILGPIFFGHKSMNDVAQYCYNSCPGSKYVGAMDFNDAVLIIKDPEIVREITVKSFDYFLNHQSFVDPDFDPLLSKNVFSLTDDRWREMRSTLSPAFTASKMKYMFQLVSKCSTDFVQYLTKHPEIIIEDVDLKDVYTRYTNDVIATAAFGVSVNSLEDRDNEFYLNGKDATSFDGLGRSIKFIGGRLFPKLMRSMGLTFLSPKADKFFKTLVSDTVKTRDEKGIVRPDMINLLMQARDNEHGVEMTTDDITAQAFIFFFAGFETSATLMCLTSHLLSHHPEIQDRLKTEIDCVLEEEQGNITYDSLSRMKYLDMVISETLRLYPPTPLTDRVCIKPYELPAPFAENSEPFVVQPKTILWVNIFGFHRDPNYFPNPDVFDPERFNDENKNNIKPYTYMPFGLGPRKCIGERFALMETKILIVQLLRHFVFKASDKTTKYFNFSKKSFDMVPESGFWMRLEKRE